MNVGFYAKNGELIETKEIILQNQKQTVVKYDGSKNVSMIIPNVGDLTFIKVLLDEQTLKNIMKNLHNIEDELTRSIVWRSLFEMVRDAKSLKSTDFIEFALNQLTKEKNNIVFNHMKSFLLGAIGNYSPFEKHGEYMDRFFSVTFSLVVD
jgi:aminopeptidase N